VGFLLTVVFFLTCTWGFCFLLSSNRAHHLVTKIFFSVLDIPVSRPHVAFSFPLLTVSGGFIFPLTHFLAFFLSDPSVVFQSPDVVTFTFLSHSSPFPFTPPGRSHLLPCACFPPACPCCFFSLLSRNVVIDVSTSTLDPLF